MDYFAIATRITQEAEARFKNHPERCFVCGEPKSKDETICESCRRVERIQIREAMERG